MNALAPLPRIKPGVVLAEQNGLCAVCKLEPLRGLCIDHDHRTKEVRGLLCDNCNSAIGFFGDDSKRMRVAGDYVDRANGVAPGMRATLVLRAEAGHFVLRCPDAGRHAQAHVPVPKVAYVCDAGLSVSARPA